VATKQHIQCYQESDESSNHETSQVQC